MPVFDTRTNEYPALIIHHDEVRLDVSHNESYVFSTEAWNFFANNFETLLALDDRPTTSRPGLLYRTNVKRMIVSEDETMGMAIYPGPHTDEWFVEFFEKDGVQKVELRMHLRTASGKGSVYKKDELRAIFRFID